MPKCIIAVPHQALASGHFLRSYDFARLESCCQRCAERPIGPRSCASHLCWECFERNYNENGQKHRRTSHKHHKHYKTPYRWTSHYNFVYDVYGMFITIGGLTWFDPQLCLKRFAWWESRGCREKIGSKSMLLAGPGLTYAYGFCRSTNR